MPHLTEEAVKEVSDTVRFNAETICKNIGIEEQFQFVLTKNPSNNLPYHNLLHTLSMVECCFEAGTHYNLPLSSLRQLCVAALFHDFDHTGGKQPDSVNIQRAIEGFKWHNCQLNHSISGHQFQTYVPRFISVTEYPYVLDPYCIEERILRDCDLLSISYNDWYERVVIGLGQEMTVKRGSPVTEREMIVGQLEFLGKQGKLYTDWGDKIFKKSYYKVYGELNAILEKLDREEK